MANINNTSVQVNYLKRDFEALTADLINWAKTYHPDKFIDFSDSNPDRMYFEAVAYVSDMLSYHTDRSFNESFRTTAQARESLVRIANDLGFFQLGTTPARTQVLLKMEVPLRNMGNNVIQPDPDFLLTILPGMQVKSDSGVIFETTEEVNFADVRNRKVIPIFDGNGSITSYTIQKSAIVVAGQTKIQRFYITQQLAQPFLSITLDDADVTEILGVTEVEGAQFTAPNDINFNNPSTSYYEVRALAQKTKFFEVNPSNDTTIKSGKFVEIPKRYIVRKNAVNLTTLTFGNNVPDIETFNTLIEQSIENDSVLATVLTNTQLGDIPRPNTTLFIKYRTGGGANTSVLAGQITNIAAKTFTETTSNFNNISYSQILTQVKNSLTVINLLPAVGGKDIPNEEEIRAVSGEIFAAQDRVVTYPDFVSMINMMPAKYGRPFRMAFEEIKPRVANFDQVQNGVNYYLDLLLQETTYTGRELQIQNIKDFFTNLKNSPTVLEPNSTSTLVNLTTQTNNILTSIGNNGNTLWLGEKARLYIVGIDEAGQLLTQVKTPSGLWQSQNGILKENIKQWLVEKRLIGDWIEINDGRVVNFQCEFTILADRNNRQQVLTNCLNRLKEYFNINNWEMNQPIFISNVETILQEVVGVITVVDLKFYNICGIGVNNTDPTSGRKYEPLETGYYRNNDRSVVAVNRFPMKQVNGAIKGYNDTIFFCKYRDNDIIGTVI